MSFKGSFSLPLFPATGSTFFFRISPIQTKKPPGSAAPSFAKFLQCNNDPPKIEKKLKESVNLKISIHNNDFSFNK